MESKMKNWLLAGMVFMTSGSYLLAQEATGETMTVQGAEAAQGPGPFAYGSGGVPHGRRGGLLEAAAPSRDRAHGHDPVDGALLHAARNPLPVQEMNCGL